MANFPNYEVFAFRYASLADRLARQNFLHGDAHDGPMPLDFFIWAIRGGGETIVVDTGFGGIGAERRQRRFLCSPAEALERVGIKAAEVPKVILTHLHYDHAGNTALFPAAHFHLQEAEIAFSTGRCMCHGVFREAMEVDDVVQAVRYVFDGRVRFHSGTGTIAPGVTVHLVGGHTGGLQVVRVPTARGWIVLASDASHFWANIRNRDPFPIFADLSQMMEGYQAIEELADGPDHIIPGHDPLVLKRFPAVPGQPDIVRVDLPPIN